MKGEKVMNDKKTDGRTYDLIAFDMDGTLLTGDKRILPSSLEAVGKAARAGKKIVLSTGRSLSEIRPYRRIFRFLDYAILESGGLIYDFKKENFLYRHTFDREIIESVVRVLAEKDIMPLVMSGGQVFLSRAHLDHIKDYHMEPYKTAFLDFGVLEDDIIALILERKSEIEKLNLYHPDIRMREETRRALSGIEAQTADGDETGIEFTPCGVNKGTGLARLCALTGIDPAATIAVGDADNDIEILETAGLGIAMANANPDILDLADKKVADNENGGCAQAVFSYLL